MSLAHSQTHGQTCCGVAGAEVKVLGPSPSKGPLPGSRGATKLMMVHQKRRDAHGTTLATI